MAFGDQADFTSRLLRLLPTGWFPSQAPRLGAVLQGPAAALSAAFALLTFVKAQTRIQTASGLFLDLISQGYFAGKVPRLQFEADAAYRDRIQYNLTAPRGTRDGMSQMLRQLTGNQPVIFQPNLPGDCLCLATLGNANLAGDGTALRSIDDSGYQAPYPSFGSGASGTGRSGAWGTLALPCQVFIILAPPAGGLQSYSLYNGYGALSLASAGGGGGLAALESPDVAAAGIPLIDPDTLPGTIGDSFVYQQISEWMPAGYTAWVMISDMEIY